MKIVIANSNKIHSKIEDLCRHHFCAEIAHTADELEKLLSNETDYIFFLHWSKMIPEEIYENYQCVVFHMTDLPYGRGGSPLQNLIVRGFTETKISAIRVEQDLDAGDIYLKKDLSLYGTAEEIFLRAGTIMFEMIREITETGIIPEPQKGEPVLFKRRKQEDGNIINCASIEEVFKFIQMLDAEGYPSAFIETDLFKFEFTRASLKSEMILADVKITKK